MGAADDTGKASLRAAPPAGSAARSISARVTGSMLGLGALFGLLYFVQGIVEPTEGLLAQPIASLLRHWGHSAASAAWFAAVLSLPWAIKPLYGLLTDFVPLAGSRRRSYLLLTTAVAAAGLTAVYALPLGSDRATLLLILLLLPAVAIAFADVVVDALMIELGQPRGMTGRLQSIQWTCIYAATIFTGVAGGALSQWGVQQLGFLIAGLCCGVSLLAVWLLVREPPPMPAVAGPSAPAGTAPDKPGEARFNLSRAFMVLRQTLREPGILAIGAFLFLWSCNPLSITVLYYYSTETLKFSEQFVGTLTSMQAVGAMSGSILYGIVCRTIPVRWLIHGSIAAGILSALAYLGYRDPTSGVIVSITAGFVLAIGTLGQLDLAARICRPQTAGTTFALLMSLTNLGAALAQGLGGSLYESIAAWLGSVSAFQVLAAVGALFMASCWLLMPILKRAVIRPLEHGAAARASAPPAPS